MDRGCIDFERLYRFTLESAFFVVRIKTNVLLQRRHSMFFWTVRGMPSEALRKTQLENQRIEDVSRFSILSRARLDSNQRPLPFQGVLRSVNNRRHST
jgi:hypothetical protein